MPSDTGQSSKIDRAQPLRRSRVVDDDSGLVNRARAGELEAFDKLVLSYQGPLYGYLLRMCRNPAEAEEMAQETFVRAWLGLSGFRGNASFRTWLFRIATNLGINWMTRRRPLAALPESLPAPARSEPDQTYRRKLQSERLNQTLAALPAEQRSALLLSVYDGMSYAEIAAVTGKTVAAVNALIYRARLAVRKALADVLV